MRSSQRAMSDKRRATIHGLRATSPRLPSASLGFPRFPSASPRGERREASGFAARRASAERPAASPLGERATRGERRATKLWGGRFRKKTDPRVERFTSSIGVDSRLAPFDVRGSIAHAKMLGRCRIIPASESRQIVRGLERILERIEQGNWKSDFSVEDVHTQIQQTLEALIGPVARKLHTSRSRNDQVALDMRLYCREAVTQVQGGIRSVQRALVNLAFANQNLVIPGYTHLQRAQPVLFAHHLLAYVEMLERDVERLEDARSRIGVLPLGSVALAGTSLPIDRRYVAQLLGFKQVSANSMDAVSDRDFALEFVSVLADLSIHLSRFAEDGILWVSDEFGLLRMDDAVATGSSLMPQKKNPDVLELIRAQAGFVIGHLTGFLTMMKGLPLSYNRDLQLDKRFVFETIEASLESLTVLECFLNHVRVRSERAAALLESDFLCATDVAEYLLGKGLAFRQAHEIVGCIVAYAEEKNCFLRELSLAEFKRFWPRFDKAVFSLLNPQQSVLRKRSEGSTHPRQVSLALRHWRRKLG